MTGEPMMRELFIDELASVAGGGPIEETLEKVWPAPVTIGDIKSQLLDNTTMACCEEGPDNCC
jgi:hypothetical protein